MGDFNSSSQSTSHPAKSSLPMLYYGLVVVGTAAIVLVVYNFIIIRWCASRHGRSSPALARNYAEMMSSSRSFQSSNRNLLSSFRFKKGAAAAAAAAAAEGGGGNGQECAVCLSAFEDGEEVKKLPRCTHMFHSPCIDMWLYSHSDCPLCRAPVAAEHIQRHTAVAQQENSGHGLLESSDSVV